MTRPRVAVSACLLGEPVRYDGGHKRSAAVVDHLASVVELIPVCPEAECGLSIPRESVHLRGDPESPRLETVTSGIELTDRLQTWGVARIRELRHLGVRGFVLKARSPSCALGTAKVVDDDGTEHGGRDGLFVMLIRRHLGDLPMLDEAGVEDVERRRRFLERVMRGANAGD